VGVYKYMRIYLYAAFSIKDFYIGGFRRNDVGTFDALRVAGCGLNSANSVLRTADRQSFV
jgi:hypothetical protein